MHNTNKITKREFLRLAGVSGVVLSAGLAGIRPGEAFAKQKLLKKPSSNTAFVPDLEIALRADRNKVSILPGKQTSVWTYKGEVLHGGRSTLQAVGDSYLGPVIRVHRGQKVRVHFKNGMGEESIIHWHGLHVSQEADGHPRFAVSSGGSYVYEFEVKNRAGTYWYHPHPHGITGPQVYFGLAGLFLVSDADEQALGLPSGDHDIPLVIQDRSFNNRNQLVYLPGGPMSGMMGFLGERVLVNGKTNFALDVDTGAYRLRILNGSNSRIYKLAWENGMPVTVIGTDGGLLEKPVQRPYVMLAPAERVDLWVDFSAVPVGTDMRLKSLAFDAGMMGGMGNMGGMMGPGGRGMGMMGGRRGGGSFIIPNGDAFTVMKVRVSRQGQGTGGLPSVLSAVPRIPVDEAINIDNPRTFRFFMQRMRWTINGRTFGMTDVAPDEIVNLNTAEVWEFVNLSAGMGMMGMPHPVHVHGLQFQVLERNIDSMWEPMWDTIRDGFIDEGLKDTVLLMPGMRIKVLLKFEDFPGLFLYHCHNLEHEDMGMMRNYLIKA